MRVKATREGLAGKETSALWRINNHVPYVALPTRAALHQLVVVRNPAILDPQTHEPLACIAAVLDTGPHFTDDDDYVFGGYRPRAESATKPDGTRMNGAGIDLGERVWLALGMKDNTDVEWEFLWPFDLPATVLADLRLFRKWGE